MIRIDPVMGGIIVAIITAVIAPIAVDWYRKRRQRNPDAGWQAAVRALTVEVSKQEVRITGLELEVRTLEEASAAKDRLIAEKDRIIGEQSRRIIASDARISQLTRAMRFAQVIVPAPDPAYAAELGME